MIPEKQAKIKVDFSLSSLLQENEKWKMYDGGRHVHLRKRTYNSFREESADLTLL